MPALSGLSVRISMVIGRMHVSISRIAVLEPDVPVSK